LSANRLLEPTGFGRFYTAWTILNVLSTPSAVLALLVTRYYADAFQADGPSGLLSAVKRAARTLAPWVALGVLAAELMFYLSSTIIAESVMLVILLPVIAASVIAVETVRAAFAAMLRSTWFGAAWLGWCAIQCALGLAGLVTLGTAWAAFAGLLAANVLMLFILAWLIAGICWEARPVRAGHGSASPLALGEALPFCSAYAGFVLLNNADVLIAYLVMGNVQLGVYSATAVLPKAIVTAIQPVAQIALPVLIAVKEQAALVRRAVAKAVGITAAMALAGCGVWWVGSGAVCGGRVGIRFCESKPMLILALAAIALSVIRVAITADLGLRRYWIAHLPLLGFLLFAAIEFVQRPSIEALATTYATASFVVLAVFALLRVIRWRT